MSGVHKYPTISFRISPREREEIEAKIFSIASYEEFRGHIEMMDVWVQRMADVARKIIATCKLR